MVAGCYSVGQSVRHLEAGPSQQAADWWGGVGWGVRTGTLMASHTIRHEHTYVCTTDMGDEEGRCLSSTLPAGRLRELGFYFFFVRDDVMVGEWGGRSRTTHICRCFFSTLVTCLFF